MAKKVSLQTISGKTFLSAEQGAVRTALFAQAACSDDADCRDRKADSVDIHRQELRPGPPVAIHSLRHLSAHAKYCVKLVDDICNAQQAGILCPHSS